MTDLKQTIAKNLISLRKSRSMTQLELAEYLNYTDKAISKWERGESAPDINVLKKIADLFEVTLDYLVSDTHDASTVEADNAREAMEIDRKERELKKEFIIGMSILLVWVIAIVCFIIFDQGVGLHKAAWIVLIYAFPTSEIVWLVLNSVWFKGNRNYFIISILMWSLLTALFLTLFIFDVKVPLIFVLGIPGQLIILSWYCMHGRHLLKRRKNEHKERSNTSGI